MGTCWIDAIHALSRCFVSDRVGPIRDLLITTVCVMSRHNSGRVTPPPPIWNAVTMSLTYDGIIFGY